MTDGPGLCNPSRYDMISFISGFTIATIKAGLRIVFRWLEMIDAITETRYEVVR